MLSAPIQRLLVANRSEIAIRVYRAASELGIRTIAIYSQEDKLSLHRFKADEAYLVGRGASGELKLGPREAYLSIPEVIRVAKAARVDAIHPGYGFLSESPEFAEACEKAGIAFIGPSVDTLRMLGNKVSARELAKSVSVPVMPASDPLPYDKAAAALMAESIGYPVMLKASWGGGGRGMRPITDPAMLTEAVEAARREAAAAFGKDEVYLEKLVTRARHVEVQLMGDRHGTRVHLFERDCTVQRRHQKIVERAPAPYLNSETRQALCEAALRIGAAANYVGAGTVEFLLDADTGLFYFIEVNPRIQVEHTVTEQVTGLDIVKAQIRIAEGGRLGDVGETGIPPQSQIALNGHALQCRITTEDPDNHFVPDYGRITAYRGAFGFGIRVDGGTAYSGAVVTRHYDPLLEKLTAWAASPKEAVARMDRALREYRIRGVATNLAFLEALLAHPRFLDGSYTTRFLDETPELLRTTKPMDRATKLLTYIADVSVNGHPDVKGRVPAAIRAALTDVPQFDDPNQHVPGTRQLLEALGPKGVADWMLEQKRVLVTDTTMRDGHQSLLATRIRTFDIARAASSYATGLPSLFSLECWGGATFDVAMRFLNEDPWERLALVREQTPNIMTQMLLRGANAVGYRNYPDNVVTYFIRQAARAGMDVFRIFDCLNWVENMRVAIDAVAAEGKIAEGAICYTGDILDPDRAKYSLRYYVELAKELEQAGCHVLGIKDMAGLLKPAAARALIGALKNEVAIPLHLHTHDTSGIGSATILAAVEAGVDAIDAAIDSMSGLTSQPCLGSLVEALRMDERDTGLSAEAIRSISRYWEGVRRHYAAFESDMRTSASEVYLHEMPGGQFTNLKEQARSLGLEARWNEIALAYRSANDLFGDIVKVTPSSKVVGDMALLMVAQDITPEDVCDPSREIAFPASVVEMMRGDLGQPPGGWPAELQKKVLKGEAPILCRPGALLEKADLAALRADARQATGRTLTDDDFASYLMYPAVFTDYCAASAVYGPVSVLPTPVFFNGMAIEEEQTIELETGKSLVIRLMAFGETDEQGRVKVFFELNGQPRVISVRNRAVTVARAERRKASDADTSHIGAPMAGSVSSVSVVAGQKISVGDVIFTIEAMKMETSVHAQQDGAIGEMFVARGDSVEAKDLLAIIN